MGSSTLQGQAISSLAHSSDILTTGKQQPLLNELLHAINHASEIEITVSFIQSSGLALIFDALYEAIQRGASLKLLTSDYLHITDPKALERLLSLPMNGNSQLRIYQCQSNDGFHMKAYIFVKNDQDGCAFIGSNNLSKQALTNAHEWALRYDLLPNSEWHKEQFGKIRQAFSNIFNHANSQPLTLEWVRHYQSIRQVKPLPAHGQTATTAEAKSPKPHQQEALEKLAATRQAGFQRGLVVLATGMGKTWLSAFDAQQLNAKRILFVAHREEILLQAQATFAELLGHTTGLYNGSVQQSNADCLFASVQTIGKAEHLNKFATDHFDYIVVDEFHHASAATYRALLAYFTPKFLLGLTATPERSDQADILSLCDNNLVYERNLVHGIDAGALVPFHYYGIWDGDVDYSSIPWRNGKFDPKALENKFATQARAKHALEIWQQRKQQCTLAFCMSKPHAEYMADYFTSKGIRAAAVHSTSALRRNQALSMLETGQLDIIFSVDLFNEGTDLPVIDTIMMLRPSESKIIFLQQLGRGLRLAEYKNQLVVLDFIGNHHSFLNKPMALLGASTARQVAERINNPSLPEGCFANYDLAISDFFEQLAKAQRTTALEDIQHLAEQLGHRPTASEFYHQYGNLDKANKQHGSWFELVAAYAGEQAPALQHYKTLLTSGIQKTSMTKCFKPITLQAFLALDGLNQAPSLAALAQKSHQLLHRYPTLAAKDIPENKQNEPADSGKWLTYWKNNPIKAFANSEWFTAEGDTFALAKPVPEEHRQALADAIAELTDYLLAAYSKRAEAALPKTPTSLPRTRESSLDNEAANDNTIALPYFPSLKIACGHFRDADALAEGTKTKALNKNDFGNLDPTRHFIAQANGNSMNGGKHPIQDGDLLILEWITPEHAGSITGKTVAIERPNGFGDEQYLLREVRKNSAGEYLLVARNPDYEPMGVDEDMRPFAGLVGVVKG